MAQGFRHGQHLLHLVVAVGEDVALAAPPLLRGGQAAGGHVPHIHEVVPAFYTGRELPAGVLLHQLYQVVLGPVEGPQNAGGMDHHRVQALGGGIQHRLGGLGLGLCVAPGDLLGGEAVHLPEHGAAVLLRDGVDRADVHQPLDPVLTAQGQDVLGAVYVHVVHLGGDLPGDVHDGGGVEHHHLPARQAPEQGPQAVPVPHVAGIIGYMGPVPGLFTGEPQPPHLCAGAR